MKLFVCFWTDRPACNPGQLARRGRYLNKPPGCSPLTTRNEGISTTTRLNHPSTESRTLQSARLSTMSRPLSLTNLHSFQEHASCEHRDVHWLCPVSQHHQPSMRLAKTC